MAGTSKGTQAFRLRRGEFVLVVMTTLTLVGVIALMAAPMLRTGMLDLSSPAAKHTHPVASKSTPTKIGAIAKANSADPAIRVVVEPADAPKKTASSRVLTEAETQEPPASPAPGKQPTTSPSVLTGRTIGFVAIVLGVALVAPAVFAFCLFFLLRRHSERFGALIQINQAVAPQIAWAPMPASSQATPSDSLAAAVEQLRIGMHGDEELPSRPDGGLFEHLFHETLELQSQLNQAMPQAA